MRNFYFQPFCCMLLSINMWIYQIKLTILLLLLANNLSWGSECKTGNFDCGNNQCVPIIYLCDGENDCENLEDERGCEKKEEHPLVCATKELKCEDGNGCISMSWYCDGEEDCDDGSDEKRCGNVTEECNGFKCTNLCIPEEFRCDGDDDCYDGSDEKLCPEADPCKNMNCSQYCQNTAKGPQCYCRDGYEIYEEDYKTCIDIDECQYEGSCSHECLNTVGGYNCTCKDGYEQINRTCRARGAEPLLIFSTNKEVRGIRLRSAQSFIIQSVKTEFTAVDIDINNERIYGIELSNASIYSVKSDGSDFKTVLSKGLLSPEDIAIDYIANNIYITDSGLRQILVCKIDGTMCYVLNETVVDDPRSVALDAGKGLMYWSDWSEKLPCIGRSGMDGSLYLPFVTRSIVWPIGIAIDHITNRLYWADAKRNTIEFVTLDGSLRKVVVHIPPFHPYSLAVFEDNLYWSEGTKSTLESCNKFSCHKKTIVPREPGIRVIGVQVYHPVLKQNVSNPCSSSNCSHMCLISPVNGFRCVCPRGFDLSTDQKTCIADPCEIMACSQYCQNTTEGPQCYCTDGYILDKKDNKTCNGPIVCPEEELLCPLYNRCIPHSWFCDGNVDCPGGSDEENCTDSRQIAPSVFRADDKEKEFLFVSEGPTVIVQEYKNGNESENLNFFLGSAMVTGLTYDTKAKRLFVADVNNPAIYAVNLTSLNVQNLVTNRITYPEDIAYDWMSSNLYWVDSTKGTVEVVSVDNHKRIILLKDLARPMSIALASYSGLMFVATIGDEDCVSMYAMDGKGKKILYSVQGFPMSLALHPSKTILYWADSRAGIISYVNYSSSRSPWILKSGIDGLMSMAVSEENMYWTASDELQSDIADRVHVLRVSGKENVTVWRKVAYSSGKMFSGKSECLIKNGGCSYLCLTSPNGRACTCSTAMTLAEDGKTCLGKKCEENDFKCFDGQCILSEMKCDENVDCNDGSDEMDCSEQISRTLPFIETVDDVTLQSDVGLDSLPRFRVATERNVGDEA